MQLGPGDRRAASGRHLRRRSLSRHTLVLLVAAGLCWAATPAEAQRRVSAVPPFDWARTDTSCTSASDSVGCNLESQAHESGAITASAGVAPSGVVGEGSAYSAGRIGATILVPRVDSGVRQVLATIDVHSAHASGPPALVGGWASADLELCVRSNKSIECVATTTVRIADSVIGTAAPNAVGRGGEAGQTVACRVSLLASVPAHYRPQQVVAIVRGAAFGTIGGHAIGDVGEQTLDAAIDEAASDMPAPWGVSGYLDVALRAIETNPAEVPRTTCTVDEVST